MATVLDDELNQLETDTEWLHTQYNELIRKHDGEFVAIKNKTVIANDKNWEKFKAELEKIGIKPSEILVEYIRDKRNNLTE